MSIQLIQQYHSNVDRLIRYGGSYNESSLRKAFQELLDHYARSKNLVLVPEVAMKGRRGHMVIPDGTIKDALRQDWGYWESKDEKDTLEDEIRTKLDKGYPDFNILFEDTHTAVLFQNGKEVLSADFKDESKLDSLLSRFISYEPVEVREFHKAIKQFSVDVGGLTETLRNLIEREIESNLKLRGALTHFLELSRQAINPNVTMANVREMIIQHVLTEDIFMRVYDEADFHRENIIARKLQEVAGTFYKGETKRNIHARIAPYYETINARASQISDHHEKQKFLKALYENFYRAYNPKAADRLGIVYTPEEIVHFMIESTDYLVYKHFGKTLGSRGVDILDPATGTGTFITELIEYLPPHQLDYKYENEIHCNEVAILPYYIANLNIEYTFKQKMGRFKSFENICFVDTLDNMGFDSIYGQQMELFVEENTKRIGRQNGRKISVIIGNPPYNANQTNENENNKNRDYPAIDKRIRNTYIAQSSAQKTKAYDMYARFFRWASDRLDNNGIIAFVTNSSFLDSRTFDGFRKVIADEFSYVYIVDLGGNVRKNPRISGTTHNVFGIKTGVAITFLIRFEKARRTPARILYARRPEFELASEKLNYLRSAKIAEIAFEHLQPDKKNNWLTLADNNWDNLMPIASKEGKTQKGTTEPKSIFKLFSNGVSTNRDEWVYDVDLSLLKQKISFLIERYNRQLGSLKGQKLKRVNEIVDYSIKWSEALKRNIMQGKKLTFDAERVVKLGYRPYVDVYYYSDKLLSDRLTANHFQMFGSDLKQENSLIAVNVSTRPFSVLGNDQIVDLHFIGDSQCFPLYRYTESGSRLENITNWALNEFQKRYKDTAITKADIFNYVYAVLHHPAYRSKYEINLRCDLPRLPFYDLFWKWAEWGKRLMELHLNYERTEPFGLHRQDRPKDTKITMARLIARKERGIIEIDTSTILWGIPSEAWEYKLGTYSALEWILERYKEKKPKDPTIAAKFNTYQFADHKEKIIDLLCRVCTVSVETMRIINDMP